MPIDPYYTERLHLLEGVTIEDVVRAMAGQDAELAERLAAFSDPAPWTPHSSLTIVDEVIAGPRHDVPVRIYRPAGASSRVLVWAHGGGFVSGDLEMPESHVVAAELSRRAGAVVVAVDYRHVGTGASYPLPIDDVAQVVAAVRSWPEIADGAVLALGGASAGAALALAAAQRTPVDVDLLLLAYPFVHFPVPALPATIAAEMTVFPPLMRFTPDGIAQMVQAYVGRIHSLPADALPGSARVDEAMPPTRVIVAEYDDLRPSGELLVEQYRQAGIDAQLRLEPGVPHGHLNDTPGLPGVVPSLEWFAAALNAATPRARAVGVPGDGADREASS